jgi:Family of unknown function (DUF6220)/Family of unknown function (DUF5957)
MKLCKGGGEMSKKLSERPLTQVIYIGLGIVFLCCLLIQFLLAGMSVFGDPTKWIVHKSFAHLFALNIPIVMVICAVIGKFLRLVYKPLAAMIFLVFMMYFTANMGWQVGWIGAFHPVAGVLLIITAGVALLKGYKIGLHTDEVKKEFKKEKSKRMSLISLIFIGAGSGLIVGFLLSNILAMLGLLLFEQPIGVKYLPFYMAVISSILVPVIMYRKTRSNHQSTESYD